MPAYSRDDGAWEQSVMRQRSSGEWSADDALGFVRDGGAWVQFQAPAGDTDLLQPINLVATPDDLEATFTWDNPTPLSEAATPTHIQFRIPETTAVWTEYVYPVTTTTISYLAAATDYQFQIRYITRVDGVIDLVGPITEVFFTTLALSGPGTPAPDPDGTGGDSITEWPTTPGGGPYTVGGSGCWWEYTIQEFDVDTYVWSDSVLIAGVEVDGDIGALTYNFETEGFDCGQVLRWKYREICNSVPGDWQYASAFNVYCDYDAPCAGVNQTAVFSSAPWNDGDVVFAMPKICYEDAKTNIEDFVQAGTIYGKLSGYHLPLYLSSTWEIRALDDLSPYGEPIVAGHVPGLVLIGSAVPALTSDFSLNAEIFLDEQPSAGSGAPVKLLEIGKTIKVYAYAEGAGWRVTMSVPKEGGGTFDLASTAELAIGEWNILGLTIDQDGDKLLYLDGALDTTDADTTRANFGDFKGDVEINLNDRARVRNVGGWSRVLTPGEMAVIANVPGIAGYVIGGSNTGGAAQTTIYKLTFETEVRTTLGTTLAGAGVEDASGMQDGAVAGYAIRGTAVERLAFPAETRTVLTATLTDAREQNCAVSNSGVGGYPSGGSLLGVKTARIDKIAFPAETKSTLAATLGVVTSQQAGHENQGVAGYTAGNVNTSGREHDKLAFPTETTSVLAALPVGRRIAAGLSWRGTAGYIAGGRNPSTDTTAILKVVYPTETVSTLAGTLTTTRTSTAPMENSYSGGGGYMGGGLVATTTVSSILKLSFATETGSTLAATLGAARGGPCGVSNSGV